MEDALYYGDNLDILRRYIKDETVDLVYLDPPFNSNANYNVLFAEKDGTQAASQIKAFDDTWHWNIDAARQWQETVEAGGKVSDALRAVRQLLGTNDMLAYLTMMAPRLVELRRVLKPTGTLYLHCDPTASHYLKVLLDAVFSARGFLNDIVWQRSNAHNLRTKGYVRVNDIILVYTKSPTALFNQQYTAYGERQMKRYKVDENGRLYKGDDLTFSTVSPARQFEWRGTKPPPNRSWGASLEQLEKWYAEGRILLKRDGTPRLDGHKVYLDETKGTPVTTNWTDIPRIGNTAAERLGYPTQKPEALLERIVSASSNEGDLVLDPFCGCGTTVAVAQKLGRKWIGIDITHIAITLLKYRLLSTFGSDPQYRAQYKVIGEPTALPDAQELANTDPYQLQWWALGLVGARPEEQKKGADKGIDGRIIFHEHLGAESKQIVLSVKAGHTTVAHVRDLGHVVAREGAIIGALITMHEPTRPMREEAASAGFYVHEVSGVRYPKIQLLTVGELLEGKTIQRPYAEGVDSTFRAAQRSKPKPQQFALGEDAPEDEG